MYSSIAYRVYDSQSVREWTKGKTAWNTIWKRLHVDLYFSVDLCVRFSTGATYFFGISPIYYFPAAFRLLLEYVCACALEHGHTAWTTFAEQWTHTPSSHQAPLPILGNFVSVFLQNTWARSVISLKAWHCSFCFFHDLHFPWSTHILAFFIMPLMAKIPCGNVKALMQ